MAVRARSAPATFSAFPGEVRLPRRLSEIELDLYRMQEAGTVVRGGAGHDATVTKLELDAETRSPSTARQTWWS
jgi:hypothetical protein